jgi:hypothetical protein
MRLGDVMRTQSTPTNGIDHTLVAFSPRTTNPLTPKPDISESEEVTIERELIRMLRDGLAGAGIPTKNRRYGLLFIDSLKWPVAVAVAAYTRDVPVWRITFGAPEPRPWPGLINPNELTLHLGEFSTQTGADLARLLREPDWRWPLFEHEANFPHYAWSKLAMETHEAHRLQKIEPGNSKKEGPT